MTEQDIQQQLSKSFAQAVAANAGIVVRDYASADYGIDGRFSDVQYDATRKRFLDTGFGIDFQLKATTNLQYRDGYFLYDLDVKNYKDLISEKCGSTRILVVYFMPLDRAEWVTVSSECAILKKGAWWCSLRGEPDTTNDFQIRVKIPENQMLTSLELRRLMDCIKGGAAL
ncbi:MAG TPA: DUF4365 domain-containing protein [Clostridia bacterium]|nr:DUF4365 domain-containing protein [Clostridia bacterium]